MVKPRTCFSGSGGADGDKDLWNRASCRFVWADASCRSGWIDGTGDREGSHLNLVSGWIDGTGDREGSHLNLVSGWVDGTGDREGSRLILVCVSLGSTFMGLEVPSRL
jgi:hypothetical protein